MKRNIYLIIALSLVLASCLSKKTIVRKYYTIEIPGEQHFSGSDTIHVINANLEIGQVTINSVYEKTQIVNRTDSYEISYYTYHQWAIRPSELVREMISEYMESSHIFNNVPDENSRSLPDYKISASVIRLETIENNESFSAHLKLEFRITDNSSEKIILSHIADKTKALNEKDLKLFAGEVSNMILEELNIFSRMIIDNKAMFSKDSI